MNDRELLSRSKKIVSKYYDEYGYNPAFAKKDLVDLGMVIEKFNIYILTNEQLNPKFANLNQTLQELKAGRWGDSVLDVANDLIIEQRSRIESLEKQINLLKAKSLIDVNKSCLNF